MVINFEAYIDSLGQLTDTDLYQDIDETMEARRRDRRSGVDSSIDNQTDEQGAAT